MTPQEIQQLIAKDIKEKSGCNTAYALHQKYHVSNQVTLHKILEARNLKSINLSVLFELYRAMGYNEINIKDGKKSLLIKPV